MKPVRRWSPLHWLAIDLMALALVAAWAIATYALAVEAWKPFGPVTPTYWTLIAFPIAIAVVSVVAALMGWQLNAMGLIGAEAEHQPETHAAAAVAAAPRQEPTGTPTPAGTGGLRPLATAGR